MLYLKKTLNIPTPIAVSKFVDAYDLMTERKMFMHVHIIYNTFIFIFKGHLEHKYLMQYYIYNSYT